MSLNAVWLTMNPNLGASARSLQDWILLGRNADLDISVVLRSDGDLKRWLAGEQVPYMLDPMAWPGWSTLLANAAHAWTVRRWAGKQGAQVIHCYEHDLYPFAVVLRAITSLPLVCHIHFAPDRQFMAWAFGGRLKKPDAVVWTSQQQQADCRAAVDGLVPQERQHVIPLGLDLRRFGSDVAARENLRHRLGIAPEAIVVGAANAFRARKRVDDFLQLVRAVRDNHPNVVGLLAGGEVPGDEEYAREIAPRIRSLEDGGRFHWLGNLEPIEPFMHATDIFVSTSEYETFGMSVLEAMACENAVVAYRGGSVHEVVGKAGLIVETGDQPGLVAAVQTVVENAELRKQISTAAKQRVHEQYNAHTSLDSIKELYRSISGR